MLNNEPVERVGGGGAMAIAVYSLEQFVADLEELVASGPSEATLFDRGSTYLERLVTNPNAIPERYRRLTDHCKRPFSVYNLHRGQGVFVSSLVWAPGAHLAPHDHGTWGMIGLVGNAIQETRFRRVDDRDRENFAVLERDREVLVRPGDVSLLIPEVDEIHMMDNPSDRCTVEIHVYGKDLVGLPRRVFNLETGQITSFTNGPSDNC
jgi:predicted metal-dependent enzyme (double-stranded beta helix superfamily)